MAFGFYTDAALSSPIDSQNILKFVAGVDGSSGNVDKVFYFGNPLPGSQIISAVNPNVDTIKVYVEDTDIYEGLQPITSIKLALTANGLANGSNLLDLGVTTLLSGVDSAVPIYARFNVDNPGVVQSISKDSTLAITCGSVSEF